MKELRYEEYANLTGEAPFVFNENIERTKELYSKKQNWHENVEIQFCIEGQGEVFIDGKKYDFNKGNIAVVNSNSIHYTGSSSRVVYSCIIIGTDFCRRVGIDYNRISFNPVFKDEKVWQLFLKICKVYNGDSSLRQARLNHILLEILIYIVDKYSKVKINDRTKEKEVQIVKGVLLYIRENYNKKITLDKIAEYVLTDKYSLCKIFKNITGQTIFENINAYRCLKAAEYIADGKGIAESGYLCGFENNSFFTKMFKRYNGTLPSKFIESSTNKKRSN